MAAANDDVVFGRRSGKTPPDRFRVTIGEALLDDMRSHRGAKAAAASIDDVGAAAAKAGTKAAGVVIDDAAVTPSYVTLHPRARAADHLRDRQGQRSATSC
jgi:hypothetical protein